MNSTLLVPIAAASLLGSVHCAAMCGSFVAAYTGSETGTRSVSAHLAYNAGRLVAYVTLGAVAGAIGHAVDLAGSAVHVGNVAALLSGGLMILWGLSAMLATQGVSLLRLRVPTGLTRRSARVFASFRRHPPLARGLALGLSSALLPCGWLYAFAVTAAGTGSPWAGAAVMFAFWSGTVPMLFGLGVAFSGVLLRLRAHVPILSAAAILAVGLFTVVSRVNLPAFARDVAGVRAEPAAAAPNVPCPLHARSVP